MAYPDCKYRANLGDVAHTVIKAVGLDRFTPKGCGCSKRRAALNSAAPFEQKPKSL